MMMANHNSLLSDGRGSEGGRDCYLSLGEGPFSVGGGGGAVVSACCKTIKVKIVSPSVRAASVLSLPPPPAVTARVSLLH